MKFIVGNQINENNLFSQISRKNPTQRSKISNCIEEKLDENTYQFMESTEMECLRSLAFIFFLKEGKIYKYITISIIYIYR
jgi:hypothetical protein